MTNTVGIGVQADLDVSQAEQKINELARQIAQANKVQYSPVSIKTVDQLNAVIKQFEQLRRIHGDLNSRMKATGQANVGLMDADWSKLYADGHSRNRQMMKAFQYALGGGVFGNAIGGQGPNIGPPGAAPGGHPVPGIMQQMANAGLRATGPVGGAAANALGLSAGAGAGLMGLLGGMLALGVSKLVSGVMDRIEKAEDNNVAYDRLKRTLGDVNVSFNGLKSVVMASAEGLKVTYDESARLSSQFAKLGNLKGNQYGSLYDELELGVGMSRSFGLDPSRGIEATGQVRGVGYTRDVNESKRFALLIGETIGKSGAFAKADEVMEALAGFAVSQTRASLGRANVGGYAGMYASMVGSGLPGLDPSGSAAILARVNAALSAGGSKGEASQFFTGRLGAKRGMDVFDTQLWREGGAFSTAGGVFGGGAVGAFYKKFGLKGPGGSESLLSATIGQLKRDYGSNPKLMLQATANHLGLSMSQAAIFHLLGQSNMGEAEKYAGDLTKLSGSGLGGIAKLFGSNADRSDLANSLLGRSDVSDAEKTAIRNAMSSGNTDLQKKVLGGIVGSRDQENTLGKDIRDSKTALDNIKTSMADSVVPYLNEMRHGIMYMAGGGKRGSDEIMRDVINADSDSKKRAINGDKDTKIKEQTALADGVRAEQRRLMREGMFSIGESPEATAERKRKMNQNAKVLEEIEAKIAVIETERFDLLARENERRKKEIERMEKLELERAMSGVDDAYVPGEVPGFGTGGGYGGSGGRGTGGSRALSGDKGSIAKAMAFFMSQGWSEANSAGIVSNLVAESGLRSGAVGDGGLAFGVAQWHPDRQRDFERWAGKNIRDSTLDEQYAFVNYELTQGKRSHVGARLRQLTSKAASGALVSRGYESPADRDGEAYRRAKFAEEISVTPMPSGSGPGRGVSPGNDGSGVAKVEVTIRNSDGKEAAPPQTVPVRIRGNWRGVGASGGY